MGQDWASFVKVKPGDHLNQISPFTIAPPDALKHLRIVRKERMSISGPAVWLVVVEHCDGAGLIVLRKDNARYLVLNTFLCDWGGLGCTMKLSKAAALPAEKAVHLTVHTSCCSRGYHEKPGDENSLVPAACDNNDYSVLEITETGVILLSSSRQPPTGK